MWSSNCVIEQLCDRAIVYDCGIEFGHSYLYSPINWSLSSRLALFQTVVNDSEEDGASHQLIVSHNCKLRPRSQSVESENFWDWFCLSPLPYCRTIPVHWKIWITESVGNSNRDVHRPVDQKPSPSRGFLPARIKARGKISLKIFKKVNL